VAISIIIPAYNEEQRIGKVIQSVTKYADEVLVIDDGSTDNTANAAKEKGAVVIQQKHSGYLAALKCGIRKAKNDIVITMDADGEHRASDIPRLIEPIISGGADLVMGARNKVPRMSERFITLLVNLKIKTGDACTGFRAMKKELAFKLNLNGACTCGTLILESSFLGAKIIGVPIDTSPVDKPRDISWYHIKQVFYVIGWLIKLTNRKEH